MTLKSSIATPAAITADGTEPLTPEQIVEQLRVLRLHIPDFGALPVPDVLSLRKAANVHDDLVQSATSTVGASPVVAGAVGKDATALRAERDDVNRWRAVQDELRAMYKGVASANLVRRHRLGLTALQTYSITRQLVRQAEHANLLPHVEEMRRSSKFGRRRRAPGQQQAQLAAPAPPQSTAAPVVTASAPAKTQ